MSKVAKHEEVPPVLPTDTETSRTIIVRVSAATHKALRIRVAQEDSSIQKWVEALVERELGLSRASKAQPATPAKANK